MICPSLLKTTLEERPPFLKSNVISDFVCVTAEEISFVVSSFVEYFSYTLVIISDSDCNILVSKIVSVSPFVYLF